MRRYYIIALILIFPVLDLSAAWLYAQSGSSLVEFLRYVRDFSVILTASIAFVIVRLPKDLRWSITLYASFVFLYMPVGISIGVPLNAVIGSAGTLLLPVLLFLVGYYCIRSIKDFYLSWYLLLAIGVASALFGMWEISHTDFWTQTVKYGEYMYDIKGSITGFEPHSKLPWNYFGNQQARRSAGLLAAPLAQGSFLIVLFISAISFLRKKTLLLGLLLTIIYGIGIYQCGTRGAVSVGLIAIVFYLISTSKSYSSIPKNLLALLLVFLAMKIIFFETINRTVNLEDSSSVGHAIALQQNIAEFGKIVFLGEGLGRQGGVAAQQKLELVGGGEGAFFSIAFQVGLPGAIAFLCYYFSLFRHLYRGRHYVIKPLGTLSLLFSALSIGLIVTFFTSDHILTFSGMAAYWLLVGGLIRIMFKQQHKTHKTIMKRQPAPPTLFQKPQYVSV